MHATFLLLSDVFSSSMKNMSISFNICSLRFSFMHAGLSQVFFYYGDAIECFVSPYAVYFMVNFCSVYS
jgi:hypothetical protein